MNTYVVRICVCLSETEVRDYVIEVKANDLIDLYQKLSYLKFDGKVTNIDVSIKK